MEALVSDEKAVHLLEQCFAYAAANERELIRLNAAAQGQSLPNKSKPPPDLPPKSPKLSPVADIEEAPTQRDGVKVDMTYSEQIRIYKTVALERPDLASMQDELISKQNSDKVKLKTKLKAFSSTLALTSL